MAVIENRVANVAPGTIMAFSANQIPSGWLICDGTPRNKKDYYRLYKVIGTTYGGDAQTFKVPDLRGLFIRGSNGTNSAPIGQVQGDAMRKFTGYFKSFDKGENGVGGVFYVPGRWSSELAGGNPDSWGTWVNFDNSLGGNPTASENRPANMAMVYCIKF